MNKEPIIGKEFVWVDAAEFDNYGGWVLDQQSMDTQKSSYLMAHGLGIPVEDASTAITFNELGAYRLWVRTRDWVGIWKNAELSPAMRAQGTPGRFRILLNDAAIPKDFGTEKAHWHWQDGGIVDIAELSAKLSLHDLTGFNGRCDAILFSQDPDFVPPDPPDESQALRSGLKPMQVVEKSGYDLIVAGGGIAGICAAISASRMDCRVALIQNRPVLGGNNSSEVRVGLSGLIRQKPYEALGNLVDEISHVGYWTCRDAKEHPDWPRSREYLQQVKNNPTLCDAHNAETADFYQDKRKLKALLAEKNVDLFLDTHFDAVEMDGNRIRAVTGQNTRTNQRIRFAGTLFADCTGDGSVGFLAGADFRTGREDKNQTQESLAPEVEDELVMGTSVQWNSRATTEVSLFPECPWAIQFDGETCIPIVKGDWDWETGANQNQVTEAEQIRDYALRAVFGNWSVLKNHPKFQKQYAKRSLYWVAYIGGKRESRRLLGEVILCQQDIVEQRSFPDACVTTTWTIDLHYPEKSVCACDAFRSEAHHLEITPYPIPYRCLYSRNIDNLFMAGRNISVTHVALGTVRVMRTTGMMGEVVGMAASLCRIHKCNPAEIYNEHLEGLKKLLGKGVPGKSIHPHDA